MCSSPERWGHLESYVCKILQKTLIKYDHIMAMNQDIATIAKCYGYSETEVARAKNYAFGQGVSVYGFFPDDDMAEAWLRLAQGEGTEIDQVFLNHEIWESDLVVNQGLSQPAAHALTQEKFPWSVLLRQSRL
ncbi:MAG: hypothetical protein GC158_06005 [Cyanobacteria bacterium RI_101]|nr:hypothetical protein [Cyanobacteria bacterium RI_101]